VRLSNIYVIRFASNSWSSIDRISLERARCCVEWNRMAGSIARSRISPISSAFHCRERAQTSFSIGKYKGTVAAGGGGLAKRGINFWTMNPANRRTTRGRLLSSSRILSSSLSFSLSLSLLVSPKLARKRRHVLDGDKRHGETARIRRGRRNDAYETRRLVYVFKLSQRNAERGRRFIPPPCSDEKREARIFPFYLQLLPRRFVGRDFPP